jgi:hypothetical protein
VSREYVGSGLGGATIGAADALEIVLGVALGDVLGVARSRERVGDGDDAGAVDCAGSDDLAGVLAGVVGLVAVCCDGVAVGRGVGFVLGVGVGVGVGSATTSAHPRAG